MSYTEHECRARLLQHDYCSVPALQRAEHDYCSVFDALPAHAQWYRHAFFGVLISCRRPAVYIYIYYILYIILYIILYDILYELLLCNM